MDAADCCWPVAPAFPVAVVALMADPVSGWQVMHSAGSGNYLRSWLAAAGRTMTTTTTMVLRLERGAGFIVSHIHIQTQAQKTHTRNPAAEHNFNVFMVCRNFVYHQHVLIAAKGCSAASEDLLAFSKNNQNPLTAP